MLAADAAREIDPDLAEVHWRLTTTKGHHDKQALRAVADRLADRIVGVLRGGGPYVLLDVGGGEISVPEAKAIVADRVTVAEGARASRRADRSRAAE